MEGAIDSWLIRIHRDFLRRSYKLLFPRGGEDSIIRGFEYFHPPERLNPSSSIKCFTTMTCRARRNRAGGKLNSEKGRNQRVRCVFPNVLGFPSPFSPCHTLWPLERCYNREEEVFRFFPHEKASKKHKIIASSEKINYSHKIWLHLQHYILRKRKRSQRKLNYRIQSQSRKVPYEKNILHQFNLTLCLTSTSFHAESIEIIEIIEITEIIEIIEITDMIEIRVILELNKFQS